jgi:DNA-binding transcriptional LysR family regulator
VCLHIGDDPIYLISQRPDDSLANHRHSAWIGGCDRCKAELLAVCRREGFTPRIASLSDDMVVVQSLVAAGIGVATLPGLALQAHRRPDVHSTELTSFRRQLYAATYGDPPTRPPSPPYWPHSPKRPRRRHRPRSPPPSPARPRPHRPQPNLAEQLDETGGDQRAAWQAHPQVLIIPRY